MGYFEYKTYFQSHTVNNFSKRPKRRKKRNRLRGSSRPTDQMNTKIKDYFRDKKEVIAVYLFGSFAHGKERKLSDVDIGIIFDQMDEDNLIEKRNVYMTELGRIIRKDIHPVILNQASEGLLKQVFSKGECLIVNNKFKHAEFKMVAFSRIVEFNFYRDQMEKGFLSKLKEMTID